MLGINQISLVAPVSRDAQDVLSSTNALPPQTCPTGEALECSFMLVLDGGPCRSRRSKEGDQVYAEPSGSEDSDEEGGGGDPYLMPVTHEASLQGFAPHARWVLLLRALRSLSAHPILS